MAVDIRRRGRFDPSWIAREMIDAGVPYWTAVDVSLRLMKVVRDGMNEDEIRQEAIRILRERDPASAEKYEALRVIKVRTSSGRLEPFRREKIVKSLVRETGLPKDLAEEIAREVEEDLIKLNLNFVSAPLIRELVNVKLIQRGLEEERKAYTRLGMPVYDVERLITYGSRENANLMHNPETIHKFFGDAVSREYALLRVLPVDLADAHMRGLIHIHDLEYFALRPFCQEHDLRFFLRRGFIPDGRGVHTAVAGPAKHPEVAVLHAAKVLAAAQTNFAGGQGFDFFNVWLAPYIQGLPYERVKQLAQMFVFEMSQMYVARGGQVVFSSISLEFDVPDFLEDVPAVLPGGRVSDRITYGDFSDEVRMWFRAFVEVFTEGDYSGRPFHFPKPEFKLRDFVFDPEYEEQLFSVHKLAAKFGSPYFLNFCADYMPDIVNSQCCRVLLTPDSDELEDFYNGKLRMGSLQVVTINLPRIAYEANGDDDRVLELLDERLEMAKRVMMIKREVIRRRMEEGSLPFLTMDCDGEPYYNLDKANHNIGFVGLNEFLKAHIGEELHESKYAWRAGLKVIKYMADRVKDFSDETGLRWSVIQTPAESAAHRLARIDLEEFGDRAVVQGDRRTGEVYYTNSSHVRPSAAIPLVRRIKIEGAFHPLVQGGAIFHVFLGEANPDPSALRKITEYIAKKSLIAYYAYTKDLTYCLKCGLVAGGLHKQCPNCGASGDDIEWYSRITGYYQRVKGWNPGKRRELIDRYRYKVGRIG